MRYTQEIFFLNSLFFSKGIACQVEIYKDINLQGGGGKDRTIHFFRVMSSLKPKTVGGGDIGRNSVQPDYIIMTCKLSWEYEKKN